MNKYVICLENIDLFNIFWNGEKYFKSIKEAREHIIFFEKMYIKNKGLYKIYELKEVKEWE